MKDLGLRIIEESLDFKWQAIILLIAFMFICIMTIIIIWKALFPSKKIIKVQ